MVETALTNADLNETDISSAPRLLEIIMQNCRGRVDHCIGNYIALALNRCRESSTLTVLGLRVAAPAWRCNRLTHSFALQKCRPPCVLSSFRHLWHFALSRHGQWEPAC
jgi:hypothetical protein